MGSENSPNVQNWQTMTNLHAAKTRAIFSEAWHPGGYPKHGPNICGHTNKPPRGEARGGLTTEEAANNWKMSLPSCERTFDAGYRMARFRPKAAFLGRERPTKGWRWSCWSTVATNDHRKFLQKVAESRHPLQFGQLRCAKSGTRLGQLQLPMCRWIQQQRVGSEALAGHTDRPYSSGRPLWQQSHLAYLSIGSIPN